jgi:hypothetical protein
MSLTALYMPLPAGSVGRMEAPLGAWPEKPRPLTLEQKNQRRRARAAQIGKSKAANRVQR